MATLKLTREATMMELRRRPFEILLDGADIGSIESHQTLELPVERGRHRLQVKTGRYSSRTLDFEADDRDVTTFRCNSARIWPIYIASMIAPRLALTLRQEE